MSFLDKLLNGAADVDLGGLQSQIDTLQAQVAALQIAAPDQLVGNASIPASSPGFYPAVANAWTILQSPLAVDDDPDGIWDAAASGWRPTVSGYYLVASALAFDGTGQAALGLYVNGVKRNLFGSSGSMYIISGAGIVPLNGAETVQLGYFVNNARNFWYEANATSLSVLGPLRPL